MTTAAGGASGKRWFDRVALWCHHYNSWLWTAYIWLTVLATLTIDTETAGPLGQVVARAGVPFLIGCMLALIGHFRHIEVFWDCQHCNELQPLNAPEEAERYKKALIARHNKRRLIAYFAIAFAVQVGLPFLIVPLLGRQFSAFAMIPLWLLVLYIDFITRKHDQLQPWCPICRRRDEDDDPIDVPAPTPPGARVEA